jgi:hypothetical protein
MIEESNFRKCSSNINHRVAIEKKRRECNRDTKD